MPFHGELSRKKNNTQVIMEIRNLLVYNYNNKSYLRIKLIERSMNLYGIEGKRKYLNNISQNNLYYIKKIYIIKFNY